jgi:hypothetical protein
MIGSPEPRIDDVKPTWGDEIVEIFDRSEEPSAKTCSANFQAQHLSGLEVWDLVQRSAGPQAAKGRLPRRGGGGG